MLNRIITLFVIARKLALSDAMKIFSKHYDIPVSIRIFVSLLSISFSGKKSDFKNLSEEEIFLKIKNKFLQIGRGGGVLSKPDINNSLSFQETELLKFLNKIIKHKFLVTNYIIGIVLIVGLLYYFL